MLSADELARAQRFVSPLHRARFVASHMGMRLVLSRYLMAPPSELEFTMGEHGKPRLVGGSGLEFSLSHSGGVALLAVADGVPVGVDVELIRPLSENIAERFFAPPEVAALAQVPDAERVSAFYACWTRKEAFLKGVGTGISGGLDSFAVSLPGQGEPALSDFGSGLTAGWTLKHLAPGDGYAGAVAIKAEQPELRCYALQL